MLTLPDTDSLLAPLLAPHAEPSADESDQAERYLLLDLSHPTPWRQSPQRQHNVAYRYANGALSALPIGSGTLPAYTPAMAEASFLGSTQCLQLDAPVALEPVHIAKPWGQEIWFSGIEERGESTVSQGNLRLPLSDYLALAPQRLISRQPPILLKILDPAADPDRGCLYFETHNTKHEVYVVTDVDPVAWPDGTGAIRLGMDQSKRAEYASDAEFRTAYLNAVRAYEAVRRALDGETDADASPVNNNTSIDSLKQQEQQLRQVMESFTAVQPLDPGDVVQVAPHIPHSLQHGVRVFEFQTPTYERNIISFNQQVLTQSHWDSPYAIERMSLAGPTPPELTLLTKSAEQRVERIVDFDQFDVLRIQLAAGAHFQLPQHQSYAMLALLSGEATVHSVAGSLAMSTAADAAIAALVPASARTPFVSSKASASFLLARPKGDAPATIATR